MSGCNVSCFYLLQAEQGFYFVEKYPSGLLKQKFEQLISHHKAVPQKVEVIMGRRLQVIYCIYAFLLLLRLIFSLSTCVAHSTFRYGYGHLGHF